MSNEFGAILRRYRMQCCLTQTQLVEKVQDQGYNEKYSKADISKWENGRTKPPAHVVEALEDIFGGAGLLLKAAGYQAAAEFRQKDPVRAQAIWEHYKEMACIASQLVYEVESVERITEADSKLSGFDYWIEWQNGAGHPLKREHLTSLLCNNEEVLFHHRTTVEPYGYLFSHLKAYFPQLKDKAFADIAAEKPHELVKLLLRLSKTKAFKGTCPICKDWQ